MPAIVENCFSSGVATVGGHRLGRGARQRGGDRDGREVDVRAGRSPAAGRYATMPNTRMPIMTSVVMTGRLMNSVVRSIGLTPLGRADGRRRRRGPARRRRAASGAQRCAEPRLQLVQVRVEHGGDVQRHDLREREAADDDDAERPARGRAGARRRWRSAGCPAIAATVVIMIGRKRTLAALMIASRRRVCSLRARRRSRSRSS